MFPPLILSFLMKSAMLHGFMTHALQVLRALPYAVQNHLHVQTMQVTNQCTVAGPFCQRACIKYTTNVTTASSTWQYNSHHAPAISAAASVRKLKTTDLGAFTSNLMNEKHTHLLFASAAARAQHSAQNNPHDPTAVRQLWDHACMCRKAAVNVSNHCAQGRQLQSTGKLQTRGRTRSKQTYTRITPAHFIKAHVMPHPHSAAIFAACPDTAWSPATLLQLLPCKPGPAPKQPWTRSVLQQ